MLRVTHYVQVGITALVLMLLTFAPLRAIAAATPLFTVSLTNKLIITEVQTTGSTASDEFVELYNTTNTDIDLADLALTGKEPWKLQFFSATKTATGKPDWTAPSATLSLTGVVPAHDYFLLTSAGYAPGDIDGDQTYNPRLSDTGGGLQLVTSSATATTVYDRVIWQQPITGQVLPTGVMDTPIANGSLQRLPNDDSEYVNTDGTLSDFSDETAISPKDMWQEPVPFELPITTPTSPDDITNPGTIETTEQPATSDEQVDNTGLVTPYLTELLPNPGEPQTDAANEFIEVYNPNDAQFDLKGYTLEVGTSTLHDFTFTSSTVIDPLAYRAFLSADTGLSLTNTGSQARLLNASGIASSESDAYTTAKDDTAWALVDGVWQWSTTPTPNAQNLLTAPAATVKTTVATTTKKPTAKTASAKVKGVSSTKTKKATSTKKKTAKPKVATVASTSSIDPRAPIHTQILVVVAVLAVLYAAYEYRADIFNRFYKLRHHRAVRKLLGLQA